MRNKLTIGLFGFGCVGNGLFDVLNKSNLLDASIAKIVVKNPTKKRSISAQRALDERSLLAERNPSRLSEFWDDKLDSISLNQLKQQKNKFKKIYGSSIFLTKKS